jgi:hypothetical protein
MTLLSTVQSEGPISASVRYRKFRYQPQSGTGSSYISLSPLPEVPISASVRYRKFRYQPQSATGSSDISLSPLPEVPISALVRYRSSRMCEWVPLDCSDFTNLIMPTLWWLQILILKHIYKRRFSYFEPFWALLAWKFQRVLKRAPAYFVRKKLRRGNNKCTIISWVQIRGKS